MNSFEVTMESDARKMGLRLLETIYPENIKITAEPNKNHQSIEPKAGSQRTNSLDGLRGIAVVLVFLEHVTGNIFPENSWLNFGSANMGRSGVYLFFVLSSFLLTSQLLRPNVDLKNIRFWLHYASRRILRVYPLYIFVLCVYLIFPSFKFDIFDFIEHIMLQSGRNHFWSIPVEVKYYLILPFIAWLMVHFLKRNLRIGILVFSIAILATSIAKATIVPIFIPDSRLSIIPSLPIFFMGSLAAIVHAKISEFDLKRNQKVKIGMEMITFGTALVLFLNLRTVWSQSIWKNLFGTDMPIFESTHWFFDVQSILWSVFLISHLHGQGWVRNFLSFSLLRYLGFISFGIYLWHIAVMGYLKTHLNFMPDIAQTVVIPVVTVLVATSTYILIERPFMRIKFSFASQH
jgi:peptidoglycan/LPS O-acetylase OafA/YrhL